MTTINRIYPREKPDSNFPPNTRGKNLTLFSRFPSFEYMSTMFLKKTAFLFAMASAIAFAQPSEKLQSSAHSSNRIQDDTLNMITIQGKVIDASSRIPVVFVSIFIDGTSIGTVTNSEGEFVIKILNSFKDRHLGFYHLGYQTLMVPIQGLKPADNTILIESTPFLIEEVTIKNQNPLNLIRAARSKISSNYSTEPVMITAFYRETVKKNKNYVAVSEAVLDVYKASYKSLETDRVRIFKGRRSRDVERMDTVLFKLQGGPYISFMLDAAKNPGEILSEDYFEFYDYRMGGIVNISNEQAYVIHFDQNDAVEEPMYKGTMYISTEDMAFVGFDFSISPKQIDKASEFLIKKKPLGMTIDVLAANYLVKYRKIDDLWYLNYVRSELLLRTRWKQKFFRSNYSTMSEMAVTDIEHENLSRYRYRESTKPTDIFVDQVDDFEDPAFWGEYNIIKPEESIEAAIERIRKRMEKKE
jgi:hypothetical protein